MGLKWERLAAIRTVVLVVGGLACLVIAAGLWLGVPALLAAAGVSALFLEFMTGRDEPAPEQGVRR